TVAVRRMEKTTVTSADDDWRKLIKELSEAFGIRRSVRLLFSDKQVSPMTWGVWSHTILLPSAAADWSEERRRLVLAHELAHVKRNDGALQIVVQIVCSVYWFNPLVWYAGHRVRIERELACDDRVLSLGAAAADYADHLVQVVRGLRTQRALSFASVSMASPVAAREPAHFNSRRWRPPSDIVKNRHRSPIYIRRSDHNYDRSHRHRACSPTTSSFRFHGDIRSTSTSNHTNGKT